MKTISVLSAKGGTGKSSISLGLAGAASAKGLTTLVVDMDPQGNTTSILAPESTRTTIATVLATPTVATVEKALTVTEWSDMLGDVDCIPADPELIKFDHWTGAGDKVRGRLSKALKALDGYDVVVIDCPPSLGALTREALAASDVALIVTTATLFGAQGVDRAIEEIEQVRTSANADLKLGGIVVNKVRSTAGEHEYRIGELVENFGRRPLLQPVMPERIAFQQAEGEGIPIQRLGTAGSREVAGILASYLTKLLRA